MTKILFVVFFISSCALLTRKKEVANVFPENWPETHYDFSNNPITEDGFQLGKMLFYDPILSRDSTISCASCHLQQTGFAHVDHDLSHGIDGRIGTRSATAIMNLAWSPSFMWDGGVPNLDRQAIAPITSHEEMDEDLKHVVLKLNRSPKYQRAFKQVFNQEEITLQNMLLALSQFELCLVTSNSKYDKLKRGEVEFTEQENRGETLFTQNCSSCHTSPLFTSYAFKNNGLPMDDGLKDIGRMKITNLSKDSLLFKVPTLRNIKFTRPYMHDGRFETLRDVLKHYSSGIENGKTVDPTLKGGLNLSESQQTDIIAFLLTLTDKEFLFNMRYGFPREDYFSKAKEE